ncbi:MAG TPA: hypothetical protein VM511_03750 [Luteolibacter sp.]|nr:hypothetical protein [Luteolibacter sp.]
MEEKAPNLQLQEPASPESLLPAHDFTPLWIGLAVLALLIVIILIVKACRKPRVDPSVARRAAYLKARKAFESLTPSGVRETAVASSLIVRGFLAEAVADPSLFETHEEFLTRQDSLNRLTPPAREACSEYFSRIARLKYAPEVPADDPAAIITDSRALVEFLNVGFLP